MAFGLTLFGTFITRSGVISSVHSFTAIGPRPILPDLPDRGRRFVYTGAADLRGSKDLRSPAEFESYLSREAAFLFNNLMLVGIAFAVFWGTIFPVLSEAVRGVKITVGPPFFNKVNGPLALGLDLPDGRRAADRMAAHLARQSRCALSPRPQRSAWSPASSLFARGSANGTC